MLWAHRVRWLLLLLTYYYVILVSIDLVPYVGAFVAPLLKPVFAVGFLAAAWSQERGEPPAIRHLFRRLSREPCGAAAAGPRLRRRDDRRDLRDVAGRRRQATRGDVRHDPCSTKRCSGDSDVRDGDAVRRALRAAGTARAVVRARRSSCSRIAAAARALATSLRAAMANWRPIRGLCAAHFPLRRRAARFRRQDHRCDDAARAARYTVVLVALLPYLAFLVATLHISDYVSYRDIFHPDESAARPMRPQARDRLTLPVSCAAPAATRQASLYHRRCGGRRALATIAGSGQPPTQRGPAHRDGVRPDDTRTDDAGRGARR